MLMSSFISTSLLSKQPAWFLRNATSLAALALARPALPLSVHLEEYLLLVEARTMNADRGVRPPALPANVSRLIVRVSAGAELSIDPASRGTQRPRFYPTFTFFL